MPKMRNGGQAAQQIIMPPHLNGTAQFISGECPATGYLPRQSWSQFHPQHVARGAVRPVSLPPPPPPPPSNRRDNLKPCKDSGHLLRKNAIVSHQRQPAMSTYRSTTSSVSRYFLPEVSREFFGFGRFPRFRIRFFRPFILFDLHPAKCNLRNDTDDIDKVQRERER